MLSLPDSEVKVMLVDLEGLNGTGTLKERGKKLQQSLIAAILASVRCLLISNTKESLTLLEEGYCCLPPRIRLRSLPNFAPFRHFSISAV